MNEWVIIILSYTSAMTKYYFFFHKYCFHWRNYKSLNISICSEPLRKPKNQSTNEVQLKCLPDHDIAKISITLWLKYTFINLNMKYLCLYYLGSTSCLIRKCNASHKTIPVNENISNHCVKFLPSWACAKHFLIHW